MLAGQVEVVIKGNIAHLKESFEQGKAAAKVFGDAVIKGVDGAMEAAESKASKRLDFIGSKLQSTGRALTMGLTTSILGAGVGAVKAAGDIEKLQLGLTSFAGSAEGAKKQMADLRKLARLPSIDFEGAVRASMQLQAVGLTAKGAEREIAAFANAITRAGGTTEDMTESVRQLSQMISLGRVNMEDLRPMMQRIPELGKIMKEQFGTASSEQIQKMFQSGKLTMEQFVIGLTEGLEKLPKVQGGISNMLVNAKNDLKVAMADLGQELIPIAKDLISAFVPAVQQAVAWFKALSPEGKKTALAIAGIAVAIGPVLWGLGQLCAIVKTTMIVQAGLTAASATASAGLKGIGLAAIGTKGSLLGLLGVVGAVVIAVKTLKDGWRQMNKDADNALVRQAKDILKSKGSHGWNPTKGSGMTGARGIIAGANRGPGIIGAAQLWWDNHTGKNASDISPMERAQEQMRQQAQDAKAAAKAAAAEAKRQKDEALKLAKETADMFARSLPSSYGAPKEKRAKTGKAAGKTAGKSEAQQAAESEAQSLKDQLYALAKAQALGANATDSASLAYDLQHGKIMGVNKALAEHLIAQTRAKEATDKATEASKAQAEKVVGWMRDKINADLQARASASEWAKNETERLKEELALRGATTNVQKVQIQLQKDEYKTLTDTEKAKLLAAAADNDAADAAEAYTKRCTAFWEKIKEKIAEVKKARKDAQDEADKRYLESMQKLAERLTVVNGTAETTAFQTRKLAESFGVGATEAERIADGMARAKKYMEELAKVEKLEKWQAQLKEAVKTIEDFFVGMLDSLYNNGFKGFFSNVIAGFRKMLADMAKEWLAAQVRTWVQHTFTSVLGRVLGSAAGSAGGAESGVSMIPSGTQFAAVGGPVLDRRAVMVGEHGPELFIPSGSGSILTNGQTRAALGGGGVTVVMNVTTPDVGAFRKSQGQIASDMGRAINRAQRRNG